MFLQHTRPEVSLDLGILPVDTWSKVTQYLTRRLPHKKEGRRERMTETEKERQRQREGGERQREREISQRS